MIARGLVATVTQGLIAKLRRLCVNPRFVQQTVESEVCMCDLRIIVQKLRSKVCAAKSSACPNPYFAHNIYVCVFMFHSCL